VTGAALGALIIGIFQAVGVLLAAEWSSAFIYLAMILVLIVRPSGLLGIPER
jgi:branched-subunit amino acid ABC-type transport system permease component